MYSEIAAVTLVTNWAASVGRGWITADLRRGAPKRLSVGLLLAGCLAARLAGAHGDLHGQIDAVTQRLQSAPSAELFLKRGELHRAHGECDAALKDFDRAVELDPALDAVHLCRGQTLFERGRLAPAKAALDEFLRRRSDHAQGHLSRARVLAALKDFGAATADYDRAIQLSTEPSPEFFVERASLLMAAGKPALALSGLDAGLKQLGPLPTLQLQAIEIELGCQHFDAALRRLDTLLSSAQRKESWLARRGDILAQAGRLSDAQRVWADALAALELLPEKARNAQVIQQLEARLRQATGIQGQANLENSGR